MARRHTFKYKTSGDVERNYEVRLMSPFMQHTVLMKVLPLVAARVAQGGLREGVRVSSQTVAQMVSAFADLREADHDYCWDTLFSVVYTQDLTGGTWQKVWEPSGKRFMYEDVDLIDAYKLIEEVVEFTYGGFFVLLQRLLPGMQAGVGGTSPTGSPTT